MRCMVQHRNCGTIAGLTMSGAPGPQNNGLKIFFRCVVLFVLALSTVAAYGQSVAKEVDKAQAKSTAEPTRAKEPDDPLGRRTPHGTIFGFLQNAQKGNYKEAAQYLQLSKNERATQGEQIARELHELMDNAFVGRVGAISNREDGSVQEDVPRDHEQIGIFRINGNETNVDLVHVTDPAAGEIWLFSAQVVSAVPVLFSQIENGEYEPKLPRFLLTRRVLSTPMWRLLAFVLLIPIALGLAWAAMHLLRASQRIWLRWRHHPFIEDVHNSPVAPGIVTLTVIFHRIGVYFLGVPLLIRVYYQRFTVIILITSMTWLVFRFINNWGERERLKVLEGSGYSSSSIVLLGQRVLKFVVVIVALLVIISILGFDMTTAVAGLGIGSIAIAFAAQKTLENLFGGISIIGDQVIRVGELCRIGEKVGTVEDISLRSTRIRTRGECTELSVPNGQLANMIVENLSRSDTTLLRSKIVLRQETSANDLRSLLKEILALLRRHAKVDPLTARVRFMGFSEAGLDIEIYCLILTGELSEFLAVREDVLLRVMDVLAANGIGLALPWRTLPGPKLGLGA